MATSREDVRDHLVAVLEAAQELPRDHREYLADVFMDELNGKYQLVPRTQKRNLGGELDTALSGLQQTMRHWWPAIAAVFAFIVVLPSLLWLAAVGFGTHGADHHPFGFLPFLFIFFLFRFLGPWRYYRRGRGSWRH
jgi:hypothetical protein